MSETEIFKLVLTSSLTIIGGVTVYVIGRIIEKFYIEPVHEQAKLIGEIADTLIFYANIYLNPDIGKTEELDETAKILRQYASHLMASTQRIRGYWFLQLFRVVPKHKNIIKAHENLIGLSNSVHRDESRLAEVNNNRRKQIEKSLRVRK